MKLTPYKKMVAVVGKYTDANGQEKNRYLTIGTHFKREDGSDCYKIDAQPVGNEWSGWANGYDPEPRQQAPAPQASGGAQSYNNDPAPFDLHERGGV